MKDLAVRSIRIEIKELSEKLKVILIEYPYIASAYLFGSQVKGTTNPTSDIDIAILIKNNAPKGRELIHEEDYLSYRIEKILNGKKVDLVEFNSQGLIFQHNILKTGKLIYDSDPNFRIKFEARVISNFCDFELTLRFIEKYHNKGRIARCERLWMKEISRQR